MLIALITIRKSIFLGGGRQEETFGGDGLIYGLDYCGEGFRGAFLASNSSNHIH